MENISKLPVRSDRDIFYYRQRFKNRVHESLTAFFAEEAERRGITKQDIAESIDRDPAQISRWLNSSSNLTLESISDLLLGLDAEMDDPRITRFENKPILNYVHPILSQIEAMGPQMGAANTITITSKSGQFTTISSSTSTAIYELEPHSYETAA
jgi:transcriptional regulator with XRE-family HTH domain